MNITISELETKNLRLAENDSQLRRKMEELRVSLNNQTDTIEQLLDQMSSLTPRNGEEVGIKVKKQNNEIPAREQVETLQNNPDSLKVQMRGAIFTIKSLSNEIPAEN